MQQFASKIKLRIDWNDIDMFHHVNNISVLRYVQSARTHYLEAIGLMQLQLTDKKGPILASSSTQFKKQLFYPGSVTIYSKVNAIKNTSFTLQHWIYDDSGELTTEVHRFLRLHDQHETQDTRCPEGKDPFTGKPGTAVNSDPVIKHMHGRGQACLAQSGAGAPRPYRQGLNV